MKKILLLLTLAITLSGCAGMGNTTVGLHSSTAYGDFDLNYKLPTGKGYQK